MALWPPGRSRSSQELSAASVGAAGGPSPAIGLSNLRMGVSDYSFPVVVRPSAYPWTTAARLEWVGWCHRAELPCGASSDNHPHVSRDLEPASPAQQKKWIAARSGVDTADFSICPCLNRSEQLGGTYPERSISCGLVSRRQQPRRCGGHGAVHGRNKYLNLFTCGGVALGSIGGPCRLELLTGISAL